MRGLDKFVLYLMLSMATVTVGNYVGAVLDVRNR